MVEKIRQGDIPGVQLRYRHQLPAFPEQVWQWATDPDLLGQWIAGQASSEPTASNQIILKTARSGDDPLRELLTVVFAEAPARLVFDLLQEDAGWPAPTRVTLEMIRRESGTEISVLQEGFAHLPLSECLTIWEAYRRRWRTALARLADLLASTP